jgi:hypothetical protein
MRRFRSVLVLSALAVVLAFAAVAGTYTLSDGTSMTGDPILFDKDGVVLRVPGGGAPQRFAWDKISQASLKELRETAATPSDRAHIDPFLESTPAVQKPITLEAVPRVALPEKKLGLGGLFRSGLGFTILLVLWAANVFAGREAAIYRNHSLGLAMGVSAIFPFFGPLIFGLLPGKAVDSAEQAAPAPLPEPMNPNEGLPEMPSPPPPGHRSSGITSQIVKKVTQMLDRDEAAAAAVEPAPELPPPTIYARGQFTFNRRFFETKLPGFFRVIPAEADKDMVIVMKSARGEFIGNRIPRVTQAEIYLQIFRGDATAEEMIPYTEIQEVQVRHRDTV